MRVISGPQRFTNERLIAIIIFVHVWLWLAGLIIQFEPNSLLSLLLATHGTVRRPIRLWAWRKAAVHLCG